MRYFLFSIMVLFFAFILWVVLPHDRLPYISFPKGAQHNTFGELPIVETMDDGELFIEDGDENITIHNCNKKVMEKCKNNAGCYLDSVVVCDNLQKQQLYADAAAGHLTAMLIVFMEENCGNSFCGGDLKRAEEVNEEFKQRENKEMKDKMKWLGNQGSFVKGNYK